MRLLDDLTIQRCVDGELDEVSQQALLTELETSPDGWRRLALAFVENQIFSQACRDQPPTEPAPQVRPSTATPRRRLWRRVATLAMTACLGLVVGLSVRPQPAAIAPPVVTSTGTAPSTAIGHSSTNATIVNAQSNPLPPSSPWGDLVLVRVRVPTKDGYQEVDLPGYASRPSSEVTREVFPPEVIAQFQERGYQLESERELYTASIGNGRSLTVPVNTVHIRQTVY